MRLPLHQLDAFTEGPFTGNPAAVCPLESWLPDALMQHIAAENNLSETAFLVPHADGDEFELRWFTPTTEVDLCGHATLASGAVVLAHLRRDLAAVRFRTRSGPLVVRRDGEAWELDLPRDEPQPWETTAGLSEALGAAPLEVARGESYGLARLADAASVRALKPAMERVSRLGPLGIIVTAEGDEPGIDFVSRFFAPRAGVAEDPVTGSAHCLLAPFWGARLEKDALVARQVSTRGGRLACRLERERVLLTGHVTPFLEGTIALDEDAVF